MGDVVHVVHGVAGEAEVLPLNLWEGDKAGTLQRIGGIAQSGVQLDGVDQHREEDQQSGDCQPPGPQAPDGPPVMDRPAAAGQLDEAQKIGQVQQGKDHQAQEEGNGRSIGQALHRKVPHPGPVDVPDRPLMVEAEKQNVQKGQQQPAGQCLPEEPPEGIAPGLPVGVGLGAQVPGGVDEKAVAEHAPVVPAGGLIQDVQLRVLRRPALNGLQVDLDPPRLRPVKERQGAEGAGIAQAPPGQLLQPALQPRNVEIPIGNDTDRRLTHYDSSSASARQDRSRSTSS